MKPITVGEKVKVVLYKPRVHLTKTNRSSRVARRVIAEVVKINRVNMEVVEFIGERPFYITVNKQVVRRA
jgi:hypothetical protein